MAPAQGVGEFEEAQSLISEAMTIFGDKRHMVVPDRVHSYDEERSLAIGLSVKRRLLTVCLTEREDRIRIISARLAEPWERRIYEISGWEKQTRS